MKISIPKEAITQIMSDYDCSEEEAAKAYLDAEEKSKETFTSLDGEEYKKGLQLPLHIILP